MVRLRGDEREVVLDVSPDVGVSPMILHWGPPLGDEVDADSLRAAIDRPRVPGGLGVEAPTSIIPEHGSGFTGSPGLRGHRPTGIDWAPRFMVVEVTGDDRVCVIQQVDEVAALRLIVEVSLGHAMEVTATLVNEGETRYHLDALSVTVPLPDDADDLQLFDGRWAREFATRRVRLDQGAVVVENRTGRTSHEHPPLFFAGPAGWGEWHGEVRGLHLAWSGNSSIRIERLPDGRRYAQLGELLHPGEVVLEPGETYSTPTVHGVYGPGLTPATWGYHRYVRATRPHPDRVRPIVCNTWEAMYFDHDLVKLRGLATLAARLGAERFVIDDGWFGDRRDDTAGLGDWTVSPDVYPDGFAPIIEHVESLGMDAGIWVEPEMVNPDSELYRQHPDWVLADDRYEPVLGRHQLVLDLARDDAFEHVLERLDALLRDHRFRFVKWDMNRPHVHGAGATGAAGSRAQTLAVYRLLDELRSRHPDVDFESCSGGGGRIDLEMLGRVDRVWASDCIDPLERQQIQRGASMLIPPEVTGSHIGAPRAHTTGRMARTSFRAATAMFGDLGLECDLTALSEGELDRIGSAIAVYRRFRPMLHGGDVVRFDTSPDVIANGVYSVDRSEALISVAQIATAVSQTPDRLRLPGLDPDRRYRVAHVALPGERLGIADATHHDGLPAWMRDPVVLTGRQLAAVGLQPPRYVPGVRGAHPSLSHLTLG